MELKPVSSYSLGIRYAAVCFLGSGNCGDGSFDKSDNDMGIDTGKQCQNEGYDKTLCALPAYLNDQCPHNSAYYRECKQDVKRACTEAGYTKETSCASGMKLKKAPRCQWDNNYGICCKETCPANSSLSCTGIVAGNDTCGYDCKKCCDNNCPAGTTETNPGGCGGSTQNGCRTKTCYYSYQSCCDNSCSGYTDESSASSNCSRGYDKGSTSCGNACYTCRSCSGETHYWNANGHHSIPYGAVCWHGYGGDSIISRQVDRTYESVLLRFHTSAVINFPMNVNGDLTIGYFSCHYGDRLTGNAIFNYPVTINGTLAMQRGSKIEFRGGVSGSYNTICYDCGWNRVSC